MNCKTAQIKISALLDGQLNEKEKAKVLAHTDSCEACKKVLDEFRQLQGLVTTNIFSREAPPCVEEGLFRQIAEYEHSRYRPDFTQAVEWIKQSLYAGFRRRALQVAGVFAAAVIVGMAISQIFIKWPGLTKTESPADISTVPNPDSRLAASQVHPDINEFLDKSSAILLEIKNAKAENPELYTLEQNVARQLLSQFGLIEPELKNSQHHYLNQLVNDLEPILTDIANLDQRDRQSLDIIRNAIEKNNYLMKIDFARKGQY